MTTTPPAPTVTALTDASPCPRVEITVTPMPSDAVRMTVWRTFTLYIPGTGGLLPGDDLLPDEALLPADMVGGWTGTTHTDIVRGANRQLVSGDAFLTDYEAPFGMAVTYTCQTFDANGNPSALSNPSSGVTLDVADPWAQDPLDPALSMAWPLSPNGLGTVCLLLGSLTGYQQPLDQQPVAVIGSPLPIGQASARQAAQQLPMTLQAGSAAEQYKIQLLLNQALTMCLRIPARVPLLDRVSYWQLDPTQPTLDRSWQWATWAMTGTQVRGPSLDVVLPVRTYATTQAEAPTYADRLAKYPTYLAAQRGS